MITKFKGIVLLVFLCTGILLGQTHSLIVYKEPTGFFSKRSSIVIPDSIELLSKETIEINYESGRLSFFGSTSDVIEHWMVNAEQSVESVAEQLMQLEGVSYAEPNYELELFSYYSFDPLTKKTNLFIQ